MNMETCHGTEEVKNTFPTTKPPPQHHNTTTHPSTYSQPQPPRKRKVVGAGAAGDYIIGTKPSPKAPRSRHPPTTIPVIT
ncbi:hypothetical protein E2C01_091801 [Portunus trituberculatus]|uniref:Uncharacterized protein n=1 Tax=Portunus trituberculatus TaxID=210409 RepID=A0A5B7JTX9_PORTR|nr:hypothetical protein [Portunus trituberculatus]